MAVLLRIWKRHIWSHRLLLSVFTALFLVLLIAPSIYAKLASSSQRYNANTVQLTNVPKRNVAIVFGAGVLPNGKPTEYLRNRIQTAAALYKAGRVKILLMSGDNSTRHYNEPRAMEALAVQLGVPSTAIVLDYAGFNTYDSCYRAHAIFGVHEATLVSQGYHLPRALMTCDALGVHSIGVAAEHEGRDFTVSYVAREFISTDKALFQIIAKPLPTVLGKAETIHSS